MSVASGTVQFSHSQRLIILSGLMLGMFLGALDQTIVAAVLPRISADLHGAAHLSWLVSAYLLTATAVTPIYGKLSDLYGRKLMLQLAIALFLATSVLCAVATTMPQLILFRALQGLGGGGLISMAHATIADVISPRERGRYQGYIAGVWVVASIAGPAMGGLFAEYLTWRWVFWINVPIALAALAVSEFALGRLRPKRLRHRIDYLGAVLVVAAVCCLLLVTTMGGEDVPWDSPVIRLLVAAAIVLFGLCVLQERYASEPILPPRMFRNDVFRWANAGGFLTSMGVVGALVFLPLYLQIVHGLAAGASGLMLIPLLAANAFSAIVAGRSIARTGHYRRTPIIGLALAALGCLLLSTLGGNSSLFLVGGALAITGTGVGLVGPATMVAVQNAIDVNDLGAGTAAINFFRSLGGALGAALFGAVLIGRLGALIGALPGHEALGTAPAASLIHAGSAALASAPPLLRDPLTAAVTLAFRDVFRVATATFFIGCLSAFLVRELPLKTESGLAERELARLSAPVE